MEHTTFLFLESVELSKGRNANKSKNQEDFEGSKGTTTNRQSLLNPVINTEMKSKYSCAQGNSEINQNKTRYKTITISEGTIKRHSRLPSVSVKRTMKETSNDVIIQGRSAKHSCCFSGLFFTISTTHN